MLVEQGADKDKANNNGWSALHVAIHFGRTAVSAYLLSKGSKEDQKKISLSQRWCATCIVC
jgi:ankyrin repeat protein